MGCGASRGGLRSSLPAAHCALPAAHNSLLTTGRLLRRPAPVAVEELLSRAGGRGALSEAMVTFSAPNSLDLLLAIAAVDDAKGRKGLSLLPVHPGAVEAALALELGLVAMPRGLSEGLATAPLFVKQGIPVHGFGIDFGDAAPGDY